MLFLGTFDYAIDERGRLPLPPRYRDAFREGIVLSQGSPDRCLRLYTQAAFDEQAAQYRAASPLQRKGRDLRKVFFSRSHTTELDKQSRILIPAALREYAGLSNKALMIGAGEWLEIWEPEAFAAEMTRVDNQLETTLESIETRE